MKKLSKLLALATGLATLFFAGCSDISDGSTGTMSNGVTDKTSNEKQYNVSFVAADGSELALNQVGINSNTVSRTIVADAVDISTGVKFYIWGKDEINTTTNPVNPKEVTFVADSGSTTTGTVVLDYTASKYFFVLAAVPSAKAPASLTISNIEAAAIYRGYANVDLRNGDAIKFFISSDGLEGGGAFKLKIVHDGSWSAEHLVKVGDENKYTITAGLYDRATGTAISNPNVETVTNTDFTGSGHQWDADDITPGTYNFVINFAGPNSKNYEYSDVIIILPNQTVEQDVEVPDVIEYAPLSPVGFKAAYIAPTVATTDSYNVLLQWTDKSKNERYFEIEYVDVSAQSTTYVNEAMQSAFAEWRTVEANTAATGYADKKSAADSAWDKAITGLTAKVKTLDYAFYGNSDQNWVAGSLQRNNQNILVRLDLGKRYIFRIAAKNDAGASDNYSYATYGDDLEWITYDNDYTAATYNASKFATKKASGGTAAVYLDPPFAYTTSGGIPSSVPSNVDTFYESTDSAHSTAIARTNLEDGKSYTYVVTPASGATYDDATSLTANLYRLTYHLNSGTYKTSDSASTSADIVEYKCQGDIDLKCPFNPPTGTVYDQLVNSDGKRWTAWKQGSISGANYGAATTIAEGTSAVNFTYYDPGDYTGYANLDLFASYNLSNAAVVAYNDSEYDFKDGADTYASTPLTTAQADTTKIYYKRSGDSEPYTYTAISDISTETETTVYTKTDGTPAISITTASGVTKKTNHYYTVVSSTAKVTFKYQGSVDYSSLKAVVKRGSSVVGAGNFSTSKTFDFETKSLPLGTYTVMVYGEYKGHTYQYSITLVLEDA